MVGAPVFKRSSKKARPPGSSYSRALFLVWAAGLVARVGFVLLEPATDPVADERMWLSWGTAVLPSSEVAFSPLAFRLIFHPPVYPYFLGCLFALFGSLTAIKCAQAVVGSLIVPALGLLGRRGFGPRAGIVVAAMAVLYPELIWFSAHFWAETLFLVMLWWAFERLAAASESGSLLLSIISGLLFGLAILTRETALYFLPLAAMWLAWPSSNDAPHDAGDAAHNEPHAPASQPARARVGAAVALLTASLAVVAPWTLRNWIVYQAFVPVSTAGALNLWQGNTRLTRQEVYERYWAVRGRIAKYEYAREMGLRAIRDRQPFWFFEKLRDEMPNFWEADSQALVHLRRGAYGTVRPALAVVATAVLVGPYLVVLTLFAVGLARLPSTRVSLLLAAFLGYYLLIHVATHGYARYRLPVVPALLLLAAAAVAGEHAPSLAKGPRRLVLGVVALVLGLSLAPSLIHLTRLPSVVSENARFGLPDPGSPEEGHDP
jgi:hypothetical protein